MGNKKDLYFHLPKELELERLFREWLKNYKDCPSQGIDSFLNYNKKINYKRLLILIGDLYSPLQVYDEAYNPELKYSDIPFINRMASIQQKYLSEKYRMLYLDFCKDKRIIQSDDHYYSYSDSAIGSKATGYRIHPRLLSREQYTWENKRIRVTRPVFNGYIGINKTSKFENYPDEILEILDMMDGWKLDESEIGEDYKIHVDTYKTFKDTESRFTYSGIGNRIYSLENNLKKPLRKHLYHEDNEDAEYQILDISNSHVVSLAYYILKNCTALMNDQPLRKPYKYKFKAIEDKLNLLREFCFRLHHEKKKDDQKQLIIEQLSKLLVPSYKDKSIDFETVYRTLSRELKDLPYNDDLVELMQSKDERNLLFIVLASSGLFFDVSAYRMEMTRAEFKGQFNKAVNLENKKFRVGFYEAIKFLEKFFPDVYDYICEVKENSNVNYLHEMSKVESNIMINHLSQYLISEGIEFVNIHDGIMYPKSCDMLEYELMFYDKYKLHIPYTIEGI